MFHGLENFDVPIVPPMTHWSVLILDLAPHAWIPNSGVPATMVPGTGVSLAVSPAPPFASIRNAPVAGLVSLPEEVAVMAQPVAALVETASCCAASET